MHLQLKAFRETIPFKPTEEITTTYAHIAYDAYIDAKKTYAVEQFIESPGVTRMLAGSTGLTFDRLVQLIIEVYDTVKADKKRFGKLYSELDEIIEFTKQMGYEELNADSNEAFHIFTLMRYNSALSMIDFSLQNYIATLIHALYIELRFPKPESEKEKEPAEKVRVRRLKKKKV